jgi:hypothetical protein
MESGDYQAERSDSTVNHEPEQLRATIERYLLGEMSTEEEAQWEAHYLECSDCLQALERAGKLTRFLKQEARLESGQLPSRSRPAIQRSAFLPLLAAAGVLIIFGTLAVGGWMKAISLHRRVAELQVPSVPQLTFSLQGPRRGPAEEDESPRPKFQLPRGGGSFFLSVPPLSATERSSVYQVWVVGPGGCVIWSSPRLGFQSMMRRFTIVCQSSFFKPGKYELRVREIRPTDDALLATLHFPFGIAEPPK